MVVCSKPTPSFTVFLTPGSQVPGLILAAVFVSAPDIALKFQKIPFSFLDVNDVYIFWVGNW